MPAFDLAFSGDGRYLAVRRGRRIALHDLNDPDATPLAGEGAGDDGTVAFASTFLVDLSGAEVATLAIPKMTRRRLTLPSECRLVAQSGRYLLLASAETTYVVTIGAMSSFAELRVPAVTRWAAGFDEDRFLIQSSRGLEVWGADSRRPDQRVALPLPLDPVAIGVASQFVNLWIATARNELAVVRISDGKTRRISLPGPPTRMVGHPVSSWVVAEIDGAPYAVNVTTATCEPLPSGAAVARAIAPRGMAGVVAQLDANGTLDTWEIGAPAAPAGKKGLQLEIGDDPSPPITPEPSTSGSKLVLRPETMLALRGGPGDAEPATLARHVPPEVERVLSSVATRLRARWHERLVAGWLSGKSPRREEVLAELVGELRAAVRAEPLLRRATVEADGRLSLASPLVSTRVAAPWTQLAITGRDGTTAEVALGSDDLPDVGTLLGMLSLGTPRGALDAHARTSAAARETLVALDRADALLGADGDPVLAGQVPPGGVVGLGGHCLLANLDGDHVLIDPNLPTTGAVGAVALPSPIDLPQLSAVFVTSDDPACLDVATLLAIDKRARVYVPPAAANAARPRQLARVFTDLGFTTVQVASPGETIRLPRGGEVRVGSAGTANAVLYLLVAQGKGALLTGASALHDADPITALRAGLASVSPVFVSVERRAYAAIERGWEWLFEPSARWMEPARPTELPLDDLAAAAAASTLVVAGDAAAIPSTATSCMRAQCYDRYAIGEGLEGWVQPRG
jgi:hypothetical protein